MRDLNNDWEKIAAHPLALKVLLCKEKELVLKLHGRCMTPLLIEGDMAKIAVPSRFRIGSLFLFVQPDNSLIVHRMIEKMGKGALMKGDRSKGAEFIPYEQIIGVVSELKIRGGNGWRTMGNFVLIDTIFAVLSKKTMVDNIFQYDVDAKNLHTPVQSLCAFILIAFSRIVRWYWVKSFRCLRNR